jgi:cell division protease FtsH
MKNFIKNIFSVLMIFIIITLLFSYFFGEGEIEKKSISLSELVFMIKQEDVSSIVIEENNLEIIDKEGNIFEAVKEGEVSLTETFSNLGIFAEDLQNISIEVKGETSFGIWFGILLNAILPILIIVGIFWFITRQTRKGMSRAFSFNKAGLKTFSGKKEKTTFKDVAGLQEAKQELKEVVDFLKDPKKFLDIGARIPRGVLLMGLPGTGKTLLARAVAGEAEVPFFHISGAEFVEMFVGVGASRVRDVFNTAKKAAPSILFVDEIDAVGRERGAGLGGGNDEREQTLNQILVEMDGFEKDTNVIVIAATNRPDVLDPALLRPGRFDRRVVLDLPDIKERESILRIHSREKKMDKNVDLRRIAERTPGFSGADLANIMNEAAILAAREDRKSFNQNDIFSAIEKVMLGPEKRSRVVSEKEKEIIAYHEAGHAIVHNFLPNSDPVQKVSIIARGMAGGYTLKVPLEDRRIQTKKQFLAEISGLLGGYLSEKIYLNDISTGASNDLKKVSELARKLVMQFGMSEKLGPITYGKSEDLIFLGREITAEKNYSEKIAEEIDKEVKKIVDNSFKVAEKILKSKENKLELLVKELLKKEIIEKEEFDKLMKEK